LGTKAGENTFEFLPAQQPTNDCGEAIDRAILRCGLSPRSRYSPPSGAPWCSPARSGGLTAA